MLKVTERLIQRCLCSQRCLIVQKQMSSTPLKTERTPLVESIERRIKVAGPLTIAEYMCECLVHPQHGYYMKKDVFGTKGDFITSPEISQMFGELLGVWVAAEWQTMETEDHLHIIELGPGRGTLASDMLRALSQFDFIRDKLSLHLIDVSPKMKTMQRTTLCNIGNSQSEEEEVSGNEPQSTKYNDIKVSWHNSIAEVPITGRCCFIAHEFFDALPIHKFQRDNKSSDYREVLIDIDESSSSRYHFRQVLAPAANANTKMFINPNEERDHLEVSPISGIITQEIASKIEKHGGFALIADYGHNGEKEDTFRGFKSHKLHNVLETPGEADLTADVDFLFLRHCVAPMAVVTHGAVSQQTFLHNMGIDIRLKVLLSKAKTEQERTDLLTSYRMLCNPDDMGERFKFFCIHQKDKKGLPAGFPF